MTRFLRFCLCDQLYRFRDIPQTFDFFFFFFFFFFKTTLPLPPAHRHLHISRTITTESSPLHIASSQTRNRNLWFPSASRIHFDGLCNYLHSFQKQLAANFFNNNCWFPFQGHVGHCSNKFTKTGLDFFIKYLLRAI